MVGNAKARTMLTEGPAQNVVTLRLDGVDEHHGHVMAHALAQKLSTFLSVFAAFERARVGSRARQTDFEVVILSHNSPSMMGLKPVPRVQHYHPAPTVLWTIEQWEKIARGELPSDGVDEDLISDVISLAKRPNSFDYAKFTVQYGHKSIVFDDRLMANAEKARKELRQPLPISPWRAGVSHGSIRGELRSVLTDHGEREIVILPDIGPDRIRCVFEESMKAKIRDSLWHFVRVSGYLHYSQSSPHPVLVEMEDIEALDATEPAAHISDGRGLFATSLYPARPADYL